MTHLDWQECTPETHDKAKGMYMAMIATCNDPRQCAQVLSMLFMNLWLQMGIGKGDEDLELALKEFCDTVRMNVAQIQRGEGKVQ